ncbi:MAG: hypothetical protein NC344_03810 [Bacteroidales bacterium]|nr:hypothetical protein [Bacteroidales bacterium]MCM1146953.1 hypothetical protein [Bacteroidales bacterium]MCM1207000.1 hypothetical protein [Bacillota bacterium]MCM1511388.1 hypothetical protein [Clostridium sp.]
MAHNDKDNHQEQKANAPTAMNSNHILADIFSRLKYMERRGSGFKKIVNAYQNKYALNAL